MLFLSLAITAAFGPPAAPPGATVTQSGTEYTLANGYVQVVFASTGPVHGTQIKSLKGDYDGKALYGEVSMPWSSSLIGAGPTPRHSSC